MSDHYIGMSSRQVNGMTVTDNYMPIELEWENVLSEVELDIIGIPMPVLRKDYKEAQVALAAYLTQIDIEKRSEWLRNYRRKERND